MNPLLSNVCVQIFSVREGYSLIFVKKIRFYLALIFGLYIEVYHLNVVNMDTRVTVSDVKGFLPMLKDCFEKRLPVSLIVDDGELRRAEGYIDRMDDTYLILEDGRSIHMEKLAAVNGIFIDSYAQC